MTARIVETLDLPLRTGAAIMARMSHATAIGNNADLSACTWISPIGSLLLATRGGSLCGIWFTDQSGIPPWVPVPQSRPEHPVLAAAIQQLDGYFQGRRNSFDLPIDLSQGTPFQQAVWQTLSVIPYGQSTSYGAIAQAIGKPKAVRAVGGAVGRNPIGIVLPCHRVLGANGALTGYTGGLERKVALLRLEQR